MNDAGQICYRLLQTDGRSLRAGIGPVKDPQIFAKKLKRSKRLKVVKIADRTVELEARRAR